MADEAERIEEALGMDLGNVKLDMVLTLLAERVGTLEKIVAHSMMEDVGSHKVFKVHSDLIQDPEVVKVIHNASRKINKES